MIKASALVNYAKTALADHWGYIWGTSGIIWTEARQIKLERTTDADRANSRKYGRQWIGHMVADCSGLIYGFYCRNGGKMVHGSDTMYRSYCEKKGTLKTGKRSDGKKIKPGTAVFTYNKDKGKYGHVGVYIGEDLVIEAMGAQHGVTTSKITKWGYWGELKGLDYSEYDDGKDQEKSDPEKPDDPVTTEKPTVKRGSSGEYVTLLQTKLINLGYNLGTSGADGKFGSRTEIAVKQFQRDWDLVEDGICGPATWKMLDSTVSNKLFTVTIKHLTQSQAKQLAGGYSDATITEEV